jgi:hypothetical protein
MGDFITWEESEFGLVIVHSSKRFVPQLAPADLQSTITASSAPTITRSASAPPNGVDGLHSVNVTDATESPSLPQMEQNPSLQKPKGMQLGTNKVSAAALVEEWGSETSSNPTAWGNDLMDVNADENDWCKSESYGNRLIENTRCPL